MRGAVARLAERVYGELDADGAAVRAGDAAAPGRRRRGRRACAGRCRSPSSSATAGARQVLAELADGRLVTVERGRVEVAHEALLREWPRLRGWLEEDAEGRRLHHHLGIAAREWDAGGRDPGELYRGARLAAALDWAAAHEPELDAARARLPRREPRRERAARSAACGPCWSAWRPARAGGCRRASSRSSSAAARATRRRAADAQRLGARALVEDELDRSLLLARQGVALDAHAADARQPARRAAAQPGR